MFPAVSTHAGLVAPAQAAMAPARFNGIAIAERLARRRVV
jgi:hypothetical protein